MVREGQHLISIIKLAARPENSSSCNATRRIISLPPVLGEDDARCPPPPPPPSPPPSLLAHSSRLLSSFSLFFFFSRRSTCIDMYHLADWMTSSRSAIERNDILLQFRAVHFTSPLPSFSPFLLRDKSHQQRHCVGWPLTDLRS